MSDAFEYALQMWRYGEWLVVGAGPCTLSSAQSDLRDWQRDCPDDVFRLVQRQVAPWLPLLARPVLAPFRSYTKGRKK